jgi:hypothetical protein
MVSLLWMSCFDKIRLGFAARLSQSIRGSVLADDQGAARRRGATQERKPSRRCRNVSKRVPEEREKGGDRELGAGSGAVGSYDVPRTRLELMLRPAISTLHPHFGFDYTR